MVEPYYYDPAVARFQVLLEEVTRARPGSPKTRFIPPDAESVDRLKAKFHHVLFGRRGTGKSSLLRHIEGNLRASNHLVAWADQETFMGLSYPDVLVSTLAEVFRQFAEQIRADLPEPASRRWGRRATPPTSKHLIVDQLDQAVSQLLNLKNAPSEANIEWTASFSDRRIASNQSSAELGGSGHGLRAKFGKSKSSESDASHGAAFAQKYTAKKSEHLERAVTVYRQIVGLVAVEYPDAFIVLDDFYRLSENDQPNIAGYLHRVVKDTSVWLKFGSIPFWTRLYAGGPPAIGLQVPHDLREISLDRGLPEFNRSKRFLEEILDSLAREVDVNIRGLFSDGSMDRLVLAAGGVPRDYIGLVSDSVGVAKNRGPSAKAGTDRVIVEDVNEAAGRTATQKLLDLDEDAGGKAGELRELIIQLTTHCRTTGSACFLVDVRNDALVKKLGRLQNMRFVHMIDSNESLPDQQSSRFVVYLLDVSQLAAQRAWRVDFMGWTKREKRRVRKLEFKGDLSARHPVEALQESEDEVPEILDSDAVVGEIDLPNG